MGMLEVRPPCIELWTAQYLSIHRILALNAGVPVPEASKASKPFPHIPAAAAVTAPPPHLWSRLILGAGVCLSLINKTSLPCSTRP